MEIECFAHGAMCIAYSGRCLMSAYLTGRSANSGFCSHSCRWNYKLVEKKTADSEDRREACRAGDDNSVRDANSADDREACRAGERDSGEREYALEESERRGEYFPVIEGDDYTALFSSKDLCMIDYLADMKKAGIDSLKIEGRMKSLYYSALVTRSYRKKIDALEGLISDAEAQPFVDELYNVAHREFGTGFYFSKG